MHSRVTVVLASVGLAAGCGERAEPAAALAAATTDAGSSTTPGAAPPSSAIGERPVAVVRLDIVDTSRRTAAAGGHPGAAERALPTTVYLPSMAAAAPLIVLAHGAGGSPEKFTELATAWSEHGYVVAVPRFPLTNDSVPQPVLGDIAEQARDVSFVIDEVLAAGRESGGALAGRVDATRIGLFGLSLGSLTVWNTVLGDCCGDRRIGAVVQSDGSFPFPAAQLADVTVPVLVAHSDVDPIFPYAGAQSQAAGFGGPSFLLTLHGAVHAAVAENTDTPADAAYQQATTAFWDRTLGGQPDAPFPDAVGIDGVTTFDVLGRGLPRTR